MSVQAAIRDKFSELIMGDVAMLCAAEIRENFADNTDKAQQNNYVHTLFMLIKIARRPDFIPRLLRQSEFEHINLLTHLVNTPFYDEPLTMTSFWMGYPYIVSANARYHQPEPAPIKNTTNCAKIKKCFYLHWRSTMTVSEREEAFNQAEASLRLEGLDPVGDAHYETVKARVIAGELTFDQGKAKIVERHRNQASA